VVRCTVKGVQTGVAACLRSWLAGFDSRCLHQAFIGIRQAIYNMVHYKIITLLRKVVYNMSDYMTGMERAEAGDTTAITGQVIQRVERNIQCLKLVINPLHQLGSELTEPQIGQLKDAKAGRRGLHTKHHELTAMLEADGPVPMDELRTATKGLWNWGLMDKKAAANAVGEHQQANPSVS
jgi:hypothetical protein